MAFLLRYWPALLGLALWAGSLWLAYDYGTARGDIAVAKAKTQLESARADTAAALVDLANLRTAASEAARQAEHDKAEELAAIADQYEQEKADALASKDRVIADLRAGVLKLRDDWQCPAVPGPAPGPGGRDAAAQRPAEAVARVLRIGAEADAQLRACQAIVQAYRELRP